jgi:hypothetical protein
LVGTRDLERSRRFYDPLFTAMGLDPCWREDQVSSWGKADDATVPRLFTGYPFDGYSATVGNGTMTAFLIDSAGRIDRLHGIAMEHGGTDEGGSGFRPQYSETFHAPIVVEIATTSNHRK